MESAISVCVCLLMSFSFQSSSSSSFQSIFDQCNIASLDFKVLPEHWLSDYLMSDLI